jgi:hypothetical protein
VGVYGLRTIDAVSLHSTLQMSISLLAFFVVYHRPFGVGYVYLIRLIKKGPQPVDDTLTSNTRAPPPVLSAAESVLKRREPDGRRYLSDLVCHHRLATLMYIIMDGLIWASACCLTSWVMRRSAM